MWGVIMGYSAMADKIRNNASTLEQSIARLEGISLDAVWTGEAHDELTSNLKTSISAIKTQVRNSRSLADALESVQRYKNNKSSISDLKSSLNSIPDTPENDSKRDYYRNKINSLESQNNGLKTNIEAKLGIESVSTQFEIVIYEPSKDYAEYVVDLADLLALFQSGSLKETSDRYNSRDSLYDFYTREEVNSVVSDIKNRYAGRSAAVNCALGVMQMAADVGIKIDYDLLRGSNKLLTTDDLVSGADCVTFASWAISQGTDKLSKTLNPQEFVNLGTKIDYSQAKMGDIFALKYADRGGHVMLVVDNDPESGRALVAEAKDEGIVLTNIKYSTLKDKKYSARDLTDIYD